MSRGHDSTPPPDRRSPLPAVRTGGERQGEQDVRVLPEFVHELRRLGRHPFHEASRLEHEAAAGETATTPLILIAGMALMLWSIVALVAAIAFVSAHLLV